MSHFHLGATSGLIATAAANGVLFSFRNPSGSKKMYVQRIRATAVITTPPSGTNHQELALALRMATFVDDYTDGTDVSALYKPTWLDKQRAIASLQVPSSVLSTGNARIADTAALTAGATPPTIFGADWAWDGVRVIGADTITVNPNIYLDWESPHLGGDPNAYSDAGCMILGEDDGFLIRMPIAIANSLVVRAHVQVEWME